MQIWPAIDLRNGKCVRLQQGDYDKETIFGTNPAEMARKWVDEGARRLHLVDLDGARQGNMANLAAVRSILAAVDVPCELGGGIRDQETIRSLIDLGLTRLVIGTRALKDPKWFAESCQLFPHRLAVGIDAKDGNVATDGWLEVSKTPATQFAKQLSQLPIAAIIYTDISKDGMLAGPNLLAMTQIKRASRVPVIASGGITTVDDLTKLSAAEVDGCIIGRALYEGKLNLADALKAVGDMDT